MPQDDMANNKSRAWIETIDPKDAGQSLVELYELVTDPKSGQLDAIMEVHSLHPAGLRAHFALYQAVMTATPGLRGGDREMIALTVSRLNECHY